MNVYREDLDSAWIKISVNVSVSIIIGKEFEEVKRRIRTGSRRKSIILEKPFLESNC